MLDIKTIQEDRAKLNRRWNDEGYYLNKSTSQAIIEGAEKYPDVTSVYYTDGVPRSYTNRETYEDGLKVAACLYQAGCRQGDIIAIQLPTWYETVVLYQAVFHIGGVVLPIVHIYGQPEVEFILEQSKAKVLIQPGRWRKINYLERCEAYTKLPDLEKIILVGDDADKGPTDKCLSWQIFCQNPAEDFEIADVDPNAIAGLIYTSGTTSDPKGVKHTHNTFLAEWNAPLYASTAPYLSNFPAGHYAGFTNIMRPILFGVPTVFMDQWDPYFAAELIEKYKLEEGGGTPIFLLTLLSAAKEKGNDLSTLTSFKMGGAGISPAQIQSTEDLGFPSGRVYGSTEHPTVTSYDDTTPFDKRAVTDGIITGGNEVRIVDDEGNDVPAGEEGELVTIGPELFVGYFYPDQDCDNFLPGGWFKTGDIAKVDAEGYLTITDRKKDMIKRGGENIASKQVEDILFTHPSVNEVSVTAMPDEIYGEKVCAFVLLNSGCELSFGEMKEHFEASGIAKQKTPERLEIVTEFPRTSSGKVRKVDLRDWLKQNP